MYKQVFLNTDASLSFQIIKRGLYKIIHSEDSHFRSSPLEGEFSSLEKNIDSKANYFFRYADLSIKIMPKESSLTEIVISYTNMHGLENMRKLCDFLEADITYRKSADLEPGNDSSRVDWFIYYQESKKAGIKITHLEIANKLNLNPSYFRFLYSEWKRNSRNPKKTEES